MSNQKTFRAVVDDTALVTNISEIKKWVSKGVLTLVIPVYTLERLHLLKRDSSQLGMNAREAVKFLDRVTSGKDSCPDTSIVIQGPADQFATWDEVETFLAMAMASEAGVQDDVTPTENNVTQKTDDSDVQRRSATPASTNALSQALLDKLNFAKEAEEVSASSTPPTTPSSSNPQSFKTSPEVTSAKPAQQARAHATTNDSDTIIVPHTSRPFINSAVFLLNNGPEDSVLLSESMVLTNDVDIAAIARKFGLNVKNIHQLRSAISSETLEARNRSRYMQKHSPKPSKSVPAEKTLFSYEDDDDEEEVVFRPRGGRSVVPSRGRSSINSAAQATHRRSAEVIAPRESSPEIPTEEIDPDSFDRGAFSRPRPTTNPAPNGNNNQTRGRGGRGGYSQASMGRGFVRGNVRGTDRGTNSRGRGKLFVP